MLVGTVFYAQVFGYFMRPDAPVVSPNIGYWIGAVAMAAVTMLFMLRRSDHHT